MGAARPFVLQPSDKKNKSFFRQDLQHGSLVVMDGMSQEGFQHTVPKIGKRHAAYSRPRFNLTFRRVLPSLMHKQPKPANWPHFRDILLARYKRQQLTPATEPMVQTLQDATSPEQVINIMAVLERKRSARSREKRKKNPPESKKPKKKRLSK